jgi:hypothetical protein
VNVPPIAVILYGLSVSAETAVDQGRDPTPLLLVAAEVLTRHGAEPPGPGRVWLLDAQAALVRAMVGHDTTFIEEAERIEAARDMAMVTMPRTDA